MSDRTARRLLLGVLAAAAVAACGIGERPTLTPTTGPGVANSAMWGDATVVLLGDSIAASATTALEVAVPGIRVDAVPGRTMVAAGSTDEGLSRIPVIRDPEPAGWVVELGTNDVWGGSRSGSEMTGDVEQIVAAIDDGEERCIWWVLPFLGPPNVESVQQRGRELATAIEARLVTRACGGVIDWPAEVSARPELVTDDGVHLSEEGKLALAALVAEAIGVAQ